MYDQLQTLSNDQLRARYLTVCDTITLLYTSWNKPGEAAAIALNWRFDTDKKISSIDLSLSGTGQVDVFREFIHTLCTSLCAEKLCIETVATKRGISILNIQNHLNF